MFTAVYLCLGLFWSLFGHKNHHSNFYSNLPPKKHSPFCPQFPISLPYLNQNFTKEGKTTQGVADYCKVL